MSLLSAAQPVQAVLMRPHGLLEAPRFGADGELVYSDVIGGGLWACTRTAEVHELLAKRRGIGGALAHARGGWVLSGRSVLHLAPDGTQREILSGEQVCGYNDLGATPEGGLLAGALRYRPLAGESARPGQLLELTPHGELRVLSEEPVWPNGIACTPDGATVYVSDYSRGVVLALARAPQRAGEPPDAHAGAGAGAGADVGVGAHAGAGAGATVRDFARSPSGSADGLALDSEGGVWVALGEGGGLARFHPDGRLHETIALPARFVSSLSFGGPDMRDVLITTADNELKPELGGTLLLARSEIAGQPLAPVRV